MSTGPKRTRSERVASIELPPGLIGRTLGTLRRGDVLLRLGLCALTAVALWAITTAWSPPLGFRTSHVPLRDVVARVDFDQPDPIATAEARNRARSLAKAVYQQDAAPLVQLRATLTNTLDKIAAVNTLAEFGPEEWRQFEPPLAEGTPPPSEEDRQKQFQRFKELLAEEGALDKFKQGIVEAFAPFEQRGLLAELPAEHQGNQEKIFVLPKGKTDFPVEVAVSDVLIANGSAIAKSLSEHISSVEVADRAFAWLKPRLPNTLAIDVAHTAAEADRASSPETVPEQMKHFPAGTVLAKSGEPLDEKDIRLLQLEHAQVISTRTAAQNIYRSLAALGMYIALYTLCGFYIANREPTLIRNLTRFASLLALVLITVGMAMIADRDAWRAELVPLLLFGMTIAISYHQELALLLSAAVALIVVLAIGNGLVNIVILTAGVSAAVLLLRTVRTRSKLLYVGIAAGVAVALTTIGIGTLQGYYPGIWFDALRYGLYAVIAGSLMTCLLPFIERLFDVQTDISLIELGDPAHPLLQELVRRAPGTYNHSITVASLAEAASEAIGARALLVRVGAYFHDIGKMLKPGYFIENQGQGDNRHESLVPAMSTLVIIAHVKDGADLARQHHLPESFIDFIQQHHGTTLVEYFYRRASEQSEADPDHRKVDESAFRYPGPKPQTREAGVLMLSDAVESASRVLVEPTPARLESLVEEIAMKRLLDGQFDECGLTLKELRVVQDSLVKSLTAVYHGRVKYPGQRTA